MDLFDHPVSFVEAIRQLQARKLMPTDLGSYQLKEIAAAVRRQSMFSAHTTDAYYLDQVQQQILSILAPQTIQRPDRVTESNPLGNVTVGANPATARSALRQVLKDRGYVPEKGTEGTIKDLSGDTRLSLVINTNVQLAQGAGHFIQGNASQTAVKLYPAWELIRFEDREVPRGLKREGKKLIQDYNNSWPVRFRAAAEAASDDAAIEVLNDTGRMIALKSSQTWMYLGDGEGGYDDTLNNPYPPFAFNSGMSWIAVSHKECLDLGLIQPGEELEPADFNFASLFNPPTEEAA